MNPYDRSFGVHSGYLKILYVFPGQTPFGVRSG